MEATWNLDLIPVSDHPKAKADADSKEKEVTEDRLYNVYVKTSGWRSFRKSQILSIDGVPVKSIKIEVDMVFVNGMRFVKV